MGKKYVMALDAGTTSNRCILFDRSSNICSVAQKEFRQIYPKPGWVEHDPKEIWSSMLGVAVEAMGKIGAEAVYCVGFEDKDLGVAVKVDDGNMLRAIPPVVVSVLDQMGMLSSSEKAALKDFARPQVINDHGLPVGEIRPVVSLNMAR